MKKTFRLILAATLFGLAFSSCTQDINVDDPALSSTKGTRVINAAFASTTKTYLGEDGLTPYFENGDEVVVFNYEEAEKCEICVSGGKAWFSTNLEGELIAVYPANQVILTDGQITGYKLYDNLSGLFKDANFARATIVEGSTTATFENEGYLFKVTPPEGTKLLTFTCTGDYVLFEKETHTGTEVVTVGNGIDALGTYYASFSPWKNVKLSFDTGLEKKNVVIENDKLLAGTMYTIDGNNWTPNYLPGKFSVSATKQVQFSRGNLQATYDGHKYGWGFAANQYDYIGAAAGNTTIDSQTSGAVVDLFGWSTAATKYGISTSTSSSSYSGDFVDWGTNIGDGSTWRTLSQDESVYLFKSRTNASSLYKCGVTVCGKENCLIIAPDNWDTSANPIQDTYDATAWATAEAAGLVCLPAAGYRRGSNVDDVGRRGFYWSSTAYSGGVARMVYFHSSNVFPEDYELRDYGCSVRLITECK